MKAKLFPWIYLFLAMDCFGGGSMPDVAINFTVQPNSIQWDAKRTSLTFMCRVIIDNHTPASITVSNLFQDNAGLCMKVMDNNEVELTRLVAAPFKMPISTIEAGTNSVFWPYYGIFGRFDPRTNKAVKLRLEGKLIGSNYTKPVCLRNSEYEDSISA